VGRIGGVSGRGDFAVKRLRTKFILAFLMLTVLPAAPVIFLARDLFEKSLGIGMQSDMESGLEAAAELIREQTAAERRELANDLFLLSQEKSMRGKWSNITVLAKFVKKDSLRAAYSQLAILDSQSSILWQLQKDSNAIDFTLIAADSIFDWGSDSAAVRLAVRLPDDEAPAAYLAGERMLPADFRTRAGNVINALQMFKFLSLENARLKRGLIFAFLSIYVPMILLSAGVGLWLSRRITAPLSTLVEATEQVASGKWQHRIDIKQKDEIGELATAFNHMVENLDAQQQQVIALEKMAAWREIARVLAHEIKNPLTPIQLMAQQMRDEYRGDDEKYRQTLEESNRIINEEIQNLRQLVREFSDFARMPELQLQAGQINDLLQEVSRLYAQAPLTLSCVANLPLVNFDWDYLRRALVNLLDNAVDAVRDGGSIQLSSRALDDNSIEIVVADTGKGILSENLNRIFEPYFSTKKSGMGLGLPIVKRIIEQHGGSVTVESALGKGTRFAMKLPCCKE
jgi:nitrogen fixation/metabolism regulation signal transduction histidine kinase